MVAIATAKLAQNWQGILNFINGGICSAKCGICSAKCGFCSAKCGIHTAVPSWLSFIQDTKTTVKD